MPNLAERLDSFAEGWKPKPGDKLIGTVTDLDSRESEYHDEPYRIITVLAEEGSTEDGQMIAPGTEKAWHAFHTTARNELEKKQPALGDHVGIAYHGPAEKAAPGMSPAERWRLIVDKRGPGNELPPEPEPSAEEEEDNSRQEERPQFETDDVIPL